MEVALSLTLSTFPGLGWDEDHFSYCGRYFLFSMREAGAHTTNPCFTHTSRTGHRTARRTKISILADKTTKEKNKEAENELKKHSEESVEGVSCSFDEWTCKTTKQCYLGIFLSWTSVFDWSSKVYCAGVPVQHGKKHDDVESAAATRLSMEQRAAVHTNVTDSCNVMNKVKRRWGTAKSLGCGPHKVQRVFAPLTQQPDKRDKELIGVEVDKCIRDRRPQQAVHCVCFADALRATVFSIKKRATIDLRTRI